MGKKVLLAEDDAATQSLIADVLQFEGFEVMSVSDGTSVPGAIAEFRPDLAILDVMMPGEDGISVLERLRADEQANGTVPLPVVMLTAKADADATWAGWRAGCDYYMNKPFEPDDLISVVDRLLGQGVGA